MKIKYSCGHIKPRWGEGGQCRESNGGRGMQGGEKEKRGKRLLNKKTEKKK